MYPFSKIPGYVWTVKYGSKTLGEGRRVLSNAEKNVSVFENTRLRVDKASVTTSKRNYPFGKLNSSRYVKRIA